MQNPKIQRVLGISALLILAPIPFATLPAIAGSPYVKDVCGSGCTYTSVQAAIDSISDSSPTKVYTVFIDSGVLTSDISISTHAKGYINFVGRGIGVSVLQASPLWFQNVGGGLTSSDFFDLTGSTGVSLTNLSVDARTADPGGYGGPLPYAGVKADPAGLSNKLLIESSEIQGITYGLYEFSAAGGLVEVYNSKIRAAQNAIWTQGANWHIYSSELRAVDNGGTSGVVGSVAALYCYGGGDTTLWASHVHAESSVANKSNPVDAALVLSGTLTVIGSTLHVKMTTGSIGASNRPMSAATLQGGAANYIGTEFLYENTGSALSQGRLNGLRVLTNGTANVVGCTFHDGGGAGGTSRSDLYVLSGGPVASVQVTGTKIASIASQNGSFPAGLAKQFDTLQTQRGTVTFAGSASILVTLPVSLPDTGYRVGLSPNANETIWITGKTTTGFTLNSSKPNSTASVDWVLMR